MSINKEDVRNIFLDITEKINENKTYLTELDAAIGDGDHGINMAKGFNEVAAKLNSNDYATIGDIIKTAAMTLISNVGGASGPLYGTLFLKASGTAKDKNELGLVDFYTLLSEGIEGVKARGKSDKDEKTMLDVLIPALLSLKESIDSGKTEKEALAAMLNTADAGVEYTKTIKATKGRASYLGDRSIGHIDPGAMSSRIMIEVINNYVQQK